MRQLLIAVAQMINNKDWEFEAKAARMVLGLTCLATKVKMMDNVPVGRMKGRSLDPWK